MATNLAIDDELIEQAQRAGRHKTKKDTVTVALQEYIKLRRRRGLLDLEGRVEFWPGYDTTDRDFERYARHQTISLHAPNPQHA